MKKNLLDNESNENLVSRVQQLHADTAPRWGRMTATEMLLHCNKAHEIMLSPATEAPGRTSPRQYLMRWLVLYLLPNFPRNVRTPKPLRTRGTIDKTAFDEQKQRFVALLRRFPQHQEPIRHRHPYFGALDTRQWGHTGWKHIDHHLRQFGV